MTDANYVPQLRPGERVVFSGRERHPRNGQACTVLGALPNPSQRAEHQWFDVRFDDYHTGRFLGRFLKPVEADIRGNAA